MPAKSDPSRWKRLLAMGRLAHVWGDSGPVVRMLCEHDAQRATVRQIPTKLDRTEFLNLIEQSQLISKSDLERALEGTPDGDPSQSTLESAPRLAQYLIDKKLLTPWQAEKLLIGKYKGFSLANYRIAELLGTSPLGAVYRAEHQTMKRLVAIKVLGDRLTNDADGRRLFFRRARTVADLDHRNLVHVFDMGDERKVAFVVMEFVPGYDLQRLVRRIGPLPLDLCAATIVHVARGLRVVHAAGQTLAGLRPSDVILDPNGVPHVLTMRLGATFANEPLYREVLGSATATEEGFAPDPAAGEIPGGDKDRFSLGAILYFMLMGSPPPPSTWRDEHIAELICHERPDEAEELAQIASALLRLPNDQRASSDLISIENAAIHLEAWLDAAR
jgi:serine/threonine protein kinase